MMNGNDAFCFEVCGLADSPDGAWESFREELEHSLSFISGFRYWKSPPRIRVCAEADMFEVSARLFSVKQQLNGVEEVSLAKEYPSKVGYEFEHKSAFGMT